MNPIYIAGGYDGYATMAEMIAGDDYDPWVASWNFTVWKKGG